MQKLQQLPKAQKLFKQYVEYQVEELIKNSQNLSSKYLSERQELVRKQQLGKNTIQEIEKSIRLLDILAKTPFEHRQSIQDVRGLEDSQIQVLREQYRNLLTKYQNDFSQNMQIDQEVQIESQHFEQSSLDLNHQGKLYNFQQKQEEQLKKGVNRRKLMGYCLKILQVTTYSVCTLTIFYRLLF